MVISASLQACGVVFPLAMLTSICRSIVTICSGLYLLIGMTRFSSKWILSHSTWYKFRRSRHFAHSRDVPAYLGLTPRRHQSGSVEQQLRISKAGNKQLRSLLVQCAQYLLGRFGPDSDLKRWGTRMFERGGKNSKKRAIVAVARKLAVLLHRLWVTGDTYHPLYNVAISSVTP